LEVRVHGGPLLQILTEARHIPLLVSPSALDRNRDVSAVVHQQGLNVEATKYIHKFTCRFLHQNDRMCLLGRAFIYMRRFCISCTGDGSLGYNGMPNLEAMYGWLSLEVPPDLRAALARLV
jgi:hypothetical protein